MFRNNRSGIVRKDRAHAFVPQQFIEYCARRQRACVCSATNDRVLHAKTVRLRLFGNKRSSIVREDRTHPLVPQQSIVYCARRQRAFACSAINDRVLCAKSARIRRFRNNQSNMNARNRLFRNDSSTIEGEGLPHQLFNIRPSATWFFL